MDDSRITITVNGQLREMPSGATVSLLLQELKLAPKFLAVELNRVVVPRSRHDSTLFHDGDQVEIVTLVGGG